MNSDSGTLVRAHPEQDRYRNTHENWPSTNTLKQWLEHRSLVWLGVFSLRASSYDFTTCRYFGGIRTAPSSRMTSPFSITLPRMCAARLANSGARPIRGGNRTSFASASRTVSETSAAIGVSNTPGAMITGCPSAPIRAQAARSCPPRRPCSPRSKPGRSGRRMQQSTLY